MRSKQHIQDEAFRDKLRYYQEIPPDHIWEGVANGLQQDRKQMYHLRYRRVAAAAAILIAAGGTWLLLRNNPGTGSLVAEERVTASPVTGSLVAEERVTASPGTSSIVSSASEMSGPAAAATDQQPSVEPLRNINLSERATTISTGLRETPAVMASFSEDGNIDKTTPVVSMDRVSSRALRSIAVKGIRENQELDRQYHLAALPDPGGFDLLDQADASGDQNSLAVGGQVTPLYSYRDVYTTSRKAGDAVIYNDMESPVMAFAGGFNLQYEPLPRLTVQSGIYYSRLGMRVENVFQSEVKSAGYRLSSTSEQLALYHSSGEITPNASNRYTRLANLSPAAVRDLDELYENSTNSPALQSRVYGSLLQHLDYVELPLILRYRMIDRKLGVNVLGGVSTNLLVGSKAYYEEGGKRDLLGNTTDIKPINYSSIVGLGLQYSLSTQFQLNLEPTFRYYLNSINTRSRLQSHPYSFGVFTGLSYFF